MMAKRKKTSILITKSVRLSEEESALLKAVSEAESISESALLKRWILEKLKQYLLNRALEDYVEKKLDLASAAHEAGISVREFMGYLERKGLAVMESEEMFWEGLHTLSETFGVSEVLRKIIV